MQNVDREYWKSRWEHDQTGWDLGQVSPPIKGYIDKLSDKNCAILIPGCGNAYEASYLLQQGFNKITIIDIASNLVFNLSRKLRPFIESGKLTILCEDFFDHRNTYDLILEQTFFCAIQPRLRNRYALKMKELLSEKGKAAGVLFNRKFEGGPPFGGSKQEYEACFRRVFPYVQMETCYNSAPPRAGSELFFILSRNLL